MSQQKSSKLATLTPEDRHRRFVETAKKVGASEKTEDFDRAFDMVVRPRSSDQKYQNGERKR